MSPSLRSGLIFAGQLAAIFAASWLGLVALRALLLEDARAIGVSQALSAGAGTLCFVGAFVMQVPRGSRDIKRLARAFLACWGLVLWTQAVIWLRPDNLDEEDLYAVLFGLIGLMLALAATMGLGERYGLEGRRLALLFALLAAVAAFVFYALVLR